jgi:hypothetical protein
VFVRTNLDENATNHKRFERTLGHLSEQWIGSREFKKFQALGFTTHSVSRYRMHVIPGLAFRAKYLTCPHVHNVGLVGSPGRRANSKWRWPIGPEKGPDLAEHEVVRWRRCSSFPATGAAITPSTICTVPADVTDKPRGKLPVLEPPAREAVRLLDAHEADCLEFFGVMVLSVSSLVQFTGGAFANFNVAIIRI